jgi:hypothetical protein
MRATLALATLIGLSNAAAIDPRKAEPLYKIELAPGDVRTVTEKEKWALRAVSLMSSHNFSPSLTVTGTQNLHRCHRP